jgi:Skp family chaperone for outer membrane proteins
MSDTNANTDKPESEKPAASAEKTFTQADVDRIVGERIAKAKKGAGDELSTVRAELEALRAEHEKATGQLSESDKVARKLTEVEKRAAAAEKARDERTAELHRTKVNYEVAKRISRLELRAPGLAPIVQEYAERRVRVGESGALELVAGDEATPLDDKSWEAFAAKAFADMVKVNAGSGGPHGVGKPLSNVPATGTPAEVFAAGYAQQTKR